MLLLLRVALSLAAVLGLLWYVQRRVGKRMQRRRDDAEISVIGRQALGSKAQLVIVETDDRRYVLGVTEHGVNVIDSLPASHVTRPLRSEVHTDFESLLSEEQQAAGAESQSLRRHRRPARPDQLSGSILSPQTWRQTADFLRRGR
ncbi:flagellar biosynthetic protein FliO [Microbacterium sp. ARD32]|nr:flagellar biosynthetic protein FliO [Microbacterium sp. ARD32]